MTDGLGSNEEIKKLNESIDRLNRRLSLGYGFLHGIFAGLGTTIGVAIVLGVTAFVLRQVIAPYLPGLQDNLQGVLQTLDQFQQPGR